MAVNRNNLKVVYKSVEELIPYVNNARTHSDEQVTQIASSIKEFGFNNPILTDGDNGVIAGHGRLLAAKKLKLDKVPVIELSGLSESQKKAYILADNKIALNSGWDEDLLKIELEAIQLDGIDLNSIGFTQEELNESLETDEQKNYEEKYQVKIDSIQYEPCINPPPILKDLIDRTRAYDLIEEIRASNLPDEEKEFLIISAYRHLTFNYKKIADYYCSASPECQRLMEKSALVMIDWDDALKMGYVKMTKQLHDLLGDKDED